jgi:Asp-tRNA(Asn)/Glu-tRNA(Gln) amidotransferase A subunit family amidase
LRLDVCQLREELFKGTFSSVDLVTVFAERCQRIGRALNLSTEENFTQALGMAMKKDQELAKAKKEGRENELGLMFGIPFSVKDLLK